jgi:hypothetical protein
MKATSYRNGLYVAEYWSAVANAILCNEAAHDAVQEAEDFINQDQEGFSASDAADNTQEPTATHVDSVDQPDNTSALDRGGDGGEKGCASPSLVVSRVCLARAWATPQSVGDVRRTMHEQGRGFWVVSPPSIDSEYVRSDQRMAAVRVEGFVDELRARASSALSFASQVHGEVNVHDVDTAM